MRKSPKSDKKKSSVSKSTLKEETTKITTPSALHITYRKNIGLIELSDSKAISVSLIRNALEQKFLAIEKISKTKTGEWSAKKDSGVWIPFHNMEEVGNLIAYAYNEGVKAGWNNNYEPQPMNIPSSTPVSETPALRELHLVSECAQINLFDSDKKRNNS